jgi:hypothetical protein
MDEESAKRVIIVASFTGRNAPRQRDLQIADAMGLRDTATMHLLPQPTDHRPSFLSQALGAYFLFGLIFVLLNPISHTDYPHQPGDWHRNLRKAFIAAAVTWLIWRWSQRSLDRGLNT